ncbi:MAG: MATE family efflux transporter [Eubacterium sp.]
MNNRTQALENEKIPHLLLHLALPSVVAQVINLLYNIVDRIYIGHIPEIGADALTGVGLFMPILMLITAFAMLVGTGGSAVLSITLGEKDDQKAHQILGNCLTALLIISVILTIVLEVSAPAQLRFFGGSKDTMPYASSYARIYIAGTAAVMLALGMNPFITAQGFAGTSMLTVMIGAVINIILDPILIFGFHMGVSGAAIATVISQIISVIWILHFLSSRKPAIRLRRSALPLKPAVIMPCLALGTSSFVMIATESLLSVVFNRSLSIYGGDIAVGAMTIITSLNNLVTMPIQGITQGGQPIISYNYGAGKRSRVREAFLRMLKADVIYAAAFCLAVELLPHMFASIFTSDSGLISYAVPVMRIYFAGIFALGFQMTCQQSFVALGQARTSLWLACLRKLILLIPLILILPHLFANRVLAVFIAEPVSDIAASAVTTAVFFRRLPKILEQAESHQTK